MKKKAKQRRMPNVPITGLLKEISKELYFGLMSAELGHFTAEKFDRLGAAINLIWTALYNKQPSDKSVLPVIEGAMRAMNECSLRCSSTNVWTLRPLE